MRPSQREVAQVPGAPAIQLLDGQAQQALAAADAVLVASGTATLETLLTGRPMVVAYRVSALTAFLLRTLGLVKVRYFSQPNLLAGRRAGAGVLPGTGEGRRRSADALLRQLEEPAKVHELQQEFTAIHRTLRLGGAARAADAILECLGRSACGRRRRCACCRAVTSRASRASTRPAAVRSQARWSPPR